MKILLFISILVNSLLCYSQVDTLLQNKIQKLRKEKQYNNVINILTEDIEDNKNNLWYNYQLACYYSLIADTINSFNYLYKSIDLGADGKDILTDTDFDNIHNCREWKNIVDTLEDIYLIKNPNITDKKLAIELWHMYIDDQRFRTLSKNYKKEFPKFGTSEYEKIQEEQERIIVHNKKRLKIIIKQKGWPTYSMVGKDAGDAVFYVFQHAEYKYLKKYLPYLKQAAIKGEASKANYAKMYDRYLMRSGKKQCYGTQIVSSGTIDKEGNYQRGVMQFHPIAEYETVNKRRAEMDLPPIEEYAKKMKVVYNPNANIKLHKFKH